MISRVTSSSSRVLRKSLLTNPYSCSSSRAIALFHSTASSLEAEQAAIVRRKKHELSRESKGKVDAIFQKILWLDMMEVHLVTELINQKLGLVLSPREQAALIKEVDRQILADDGHEAENTGGEAVEEAEVVKTVDLKLVGFDVQSKIKVIKEVRSIAGLGLKEAKELVESAPKIIQKGMKPEEAEKLKEQLEAVGAEIELT